MLEISPQKIAHVIVKAREFDAKVAPWEETQNPATSAEDAASILEDMSGDATRSEAAEFIANLNEDEQVHLVALAWLGRGSFEADQWADAVETARLERVNKTEAYLLGIPLLADYLEEGLEKLGYSVEDAEFGIL